MHTKSFEISRKEIAQLHFDNGDILLDQAAVRKRSEAIHKATYLGNLKHQKVVISFKTGSNIYKVHTTYLVDLWKLHLSKGRCSYTRRANTGCGILVIAT